MHRIMLFLIRGSTGNKEVCFPDTHKEKTSESRQTHKYTQKRHIIKMSIINILKNE